MTISINILIFITLICLEVSLHTSCVRIVRLSIPRTVDASNTSEVILDCEYEYDDNDLMLVVKWHLNYNPDPIYRWVPQTQSRYFGHLLHYHFDKNYSINTNDINLKFRAIKLRNITINLSGNYTCMVSSLAGGDTSEGQMAVYVSGYEDSYCGPPIDPLTVQEIQSYGYPITEYKPNMNCKWNIEAQYGYDINIEFVEFNTHWTDKLNVYDTKSYGISIEKRLIKSYSGKINSTTLTTKSNSLIIEFKTDSSNQSKGFLLRIHRENKCHAFNSRTVKSLFSPDYPSNYTNNIECSWIITADQNEFITLYFEKLSLRTRYDDNYNNYNSYVTADKLYVYNNRNINPLEPILLLQQNIESYYFKTNSSSITVVFKSVSGYSDLGFQIDIFRNKKVLDIKSCGERINSNNTRIISPNYPGNYENNINCIWNINGINNSIIHLTFNDFSTQPMRDVLYVYDGNTTNHTLIGEYSGFSLPDNLTSTSNDITIVFKSDESNVETGFDITIKFEILLENTFFFISQTKYSSQKYSVNYFKSNLDSNETIAENDNNYYNIIAFNVKKSFLVLFKDQSNEIEIHENPKKPAMNSNAITVIKNVGKPNSIAIDWIHDLVYWIDSENNEIKAIEYLEPNNIYSIDKSNVSQYKNLIINVEKSFLLWISFEKRYEIIQSTQDGENKKTIYRNNRLIKHLVIDYHSKKYYFILGNSLVSLDFNAQNQNKVSNYENNFDSIINLFILNKEFFYVKHNLLYKLADNQFDNPIVIMKSREYYNSNEESKQVYYGRKVLDVQRIHYIIGFDNQSQPEFEDKCLTSNCSYACVPTQSPDNHRCLCPINMDRVNQTDCQIRQ